MVDVAGVPGQFVVEGVVPVREALSVLGGRHDWFREGRAATRGEALAALDSAMPILRQTAENEPHPEQAQTQLDRQYHRALALLPVETAVR
ncbi:hypothetical protein [Streptomyces sp. HUCO-GS316]|uniref:hypothetical protein n=1 Tax=Streptomyces sp. HUCO-GS316 TaxID=2692198 RepID=UPI001926883A|nr:hypothetical protein [Streptomyces sp. HUCO-GS316]